jgi:hypothetical protein
MSLEAFTEEAGCEFKIEFRILIRNLLIRNFQSRLKKRYIKQSKFGVEQEVIGYESD